MKRFSTTLFLLSFFMLPAFAAPKKIILRDTGAIDNRTGLPMYFDLPEAYYDESPKGQLIIIIGDGAVSYYGVEISSPVTGAVEITTTVDGTYDTFSISSLSAGSHVITIAE